MKSARRILGTLTATAALTAAAVFGLASPAAADVSITPSEAIQGGGLSMILRVSNDSTTATLGKVELQLPADSQMQDVFPVAVGDDDFTPLVNMRWLVPPAANEPSQPAAPPADDSAEEGDSEEPVADDPEAGGKKIPSGVVWTALPGREIKPGAATDLRLSMGPMPRTNRMVLGVVLTYSDGTVVRYTGQPGPGERQAPVLALRPPRPGEEEAAAKAHGATSDGRSESKSGSGTTMWWLLGAVAVAWILATALILRRRRAATPAMKPAMAKAPPSARRQAKATAQPAKTAKAPAKKQAAKSTNAARPTKQRMKKTLAAAGKAAKSDNKESTQ